MSGRRVAVVGASIAGITCAEALRGLNFGGEITILEQERGEPYQCPPLSKAVLGGQPSSVADITTRAALATADIELRDGAQVEALDAAARTIRVDGSLMGYTDLVIATGAAPIVPFPVYSPRVHVLRTKRDAEAIVTAVHTGRHVVVVGGGVLGSEIASAIRRHGCTTTLVTDRPCLTLGPVNGLLGRELARLHRDAGVGLMFDTDVLGVTDDGEQAVLAMSNRPPIRADAIIVAAGARPQTAWLRDQLAVDQRGVLCDATGRAADGVWAAGDAACWATPVGFRGTQTAAIDQARVVASDIAGTPPPALLPPYFWAEIHGVRIQVVGALPEGTVHEILPTSDSDSTEPARFTILAKVADAVVGAISCGDARGFRTARARLQPLEAATPMVAQR